MSERWNCHDHRDELRVGPESTVFHPDHGILCYYYIEWNGTFYFPFKFKDKAAAYKWIQSGYISELQEGMTWLQVGFSDKMFIKSESFAEYMERL